MAFRFEVFIPSRSVWIVEDEHRGRVGERMLSRTQYERAMLRAQPGLRDGQHGYHSFRRYRITEFDAPKSPPGIPIAIPELRKLGRALAK